MKNPILYLIFFITVGIHSFANSANLTATVDRASINQNESLRLTVILDEVTSNTIDFSQLNKQFDIINQQRSARQSIINGNLTASTQWTLILLPKETGQLLIPSFEHNGNFSDAIPITVSAKTSTISSNEDVFLEVSTNKSSVYVQEQLLVTLKLFYKINLSTYEASSFSVENSLIEKIKENTYSTTVNNNHYNVLEIVYVVNPQLAGKLTIPVQTWRLKKPSSRLQFNFDDQYYVTRSDEITIEAKPIPDTYTNKSWLPSPSVTMNSEWKNSIIQARVGEPVHLQINVLGEGLFPSQIPELTIDNTEDFSVFKDQSQTDKQVSNLSLNGLRVENFAVIPKKNGTLTFPEIRINWWNTTTNIEETVTIPEQTIIVANSQITDDPIEVIDSTVIDRPTVNSETPSISQGLWKISTFIFAISTFILCILVVKLKNYSITTSDKANVSTGNNSDQKQTKNILSQLESATTRDDWLAIRQLVTNLSTLEPDQKKRCLNEIDQLLFDHSDKSQVNSNVIADILSELHEKKGKKPTKQALEELYIP